MPPSRLSVARTPQNDRGTCYEEEMNVGSQAPLGSKNLFDTPGVHLPGYVRELARAFMRNGLSKSAAISRAVGVIKRWARGGGDVKPGTRAKAARALAQWEAAKAKARATPNRK